MDAERLAKLQSRIALARGETSPDRDSLGHRGDDGGGLNAALRVATEMVASLVVSILIGWLLDRWLGTRPLLAIVFFFIGIAAGMLNVYRAMNRMGLGAGYKAPEAKVDEKNTMSEVTRNGRDSE